MSLTRSLSYYVDKPYYDRPKNVIKWAVSLGAGVKKTPATRKQRILTCVINLRDNTFQSFSGFNIFTFLFDRQQVGRKRAAGDIQVEMVVNFQQMVTQATRDMVCAANAYFEKILIFLVN